MTSAEASTETGAVPFRPGLIELGADGDGHLLGSRCPDCGACFFPARHVCSRCLTEGLDPARLSTRGTVYSCTVVHQAAPEFEVPYALGYVDLPEGVRVLGQIVGVAPEAVCIGMEVELALEPVAESDGQQLIGYRFRALAEEET